MIATFDDFVDICENASSKTKAVILDVALYKFKKENKSRTKTIHLPYIENKSRTKTIHLPYIENKSRTKTIHLPYIENKSRTKTIHLPYKENKSRTKTIHLPYKENKSRTKTIHLPYIADMVSIIFKKGKSSMFVKESFEC